MGTSKQVEIAWYWELADKFRSVRYPDGFLQLLREARSRGLLTSWRDISSLARVDPRAAELVDPPVVVDFMVALCAQMQPGRVLDPWAGIGVTLRALDDAGLVREGVGIELNPEVHELVQELSDSERLNWICADAGESVPELAGELDLVVGSPPMGLPSRALDSGDPEIHLRASGTYTMLVQAAMKLSPTAQMAVILPQAFLQPSARPVRDALAELSVYVSAAFALPARAFRTKLPTGVVVLDRRQHDELFVAELDPSVDVAALLSNFRARTEAKLPQLGRLVPVGGFTSWRHVTRGADIQEMARRAGLQPMPIGQICTAIRIPAPDGEPFAAIPHSVFLPKIGTSPAVTTLEELQIKPENYVQLVVDLDFADPAYVAGFFNSPLGKLVREQFTSGGTIPQLSLERIREGTVFMPPSLEHQRNASAVSRTLRELQLEIQSLERRLWEYPLAAQETEQQLRRLREGDGLERWMDSLPFPLASILWRYSVSDDPEDQCRHLINFFEATTLFLVDLHWSALHAEVELTRGADAPVDGPTSYTRGSIGIWANLLGRLAKRSRGLISSNRPLALDLFRVSDSSRLDAISAKVVTRSLKDEAAAYRINWIAHTAPVNVAAWRQRLSLAEETLARIREGLGNAFEGWDLVRPGPGRRRNGIVTTRLEFVMGSRTLFRQGEADLRELPDEGDLYMLEQDASLPLPLAPLVSLRRSPETVEDACYFYDRLEGGSVRWISYHYAAQSEVFAADDSVVSMIQELDSLG